MIYKADNIPIDINLLTKDNVREVIIKHLKLDENLVKKFTVLKKSIDSRKHSSKTIYFVYSVKFEYPEIIKKSYISLYEEPKLITPQLSNLSSNCIIVGAGPAGLFCALRLLEYGIKSIVIERGQDINKRVENVNDFWNNSTLLPNSNVQFGLGGAGAFSDAKLTSRIKTNYTNYIKDKLMEFGVSKKVFENAKPHIGTDKMRKVVSNIKDYLVQNGVEFKFDSLVTDIVINKEKVSSVVVNDKEEINCTNLFLAIGNGARDTFEMLQRKNVALEIKPFAVGLRIEHKQEDIDKYIYGKFYGNELLKSATYNLTYKDIESNRGVYTFCNCPGGYVIGSSSEKDGVVTNGMSFSKRNNDNANSAVVVSVGKDDFESDSPLAGMYFQRKLENETYLLGGGSYKAPVMYLSDLLNINKKSDVVSTYKPGVVHEDLNKCLPKFIINPIKNALKSFANHIDNFDTGILTAVETRTSSPLRIIRNKDTLESVNIKGLFPIGEGSGYAGGIMSSGVDGVVVVDKIFAN